MTSTPTDMNKWLAQTFAAILSSPHISMPSHIGNMRLGPGPIDLFSTRFANTFTQDVQATVAGQQVTYDKLKEDLLGLQKHWSTDAQFADPLQPPDGDNVISTTCSWVPPNPDASSSGHNEVELLISAKTAENGGNLMINCIDLRGDSWLFV